jgi:hypothetical protein
MQRAAVAGRSIHCPAMGPEAIRWMLQELDGEAVTSRWRVISTQDHVIGEYARQFAQTLQPAFNEFERRARPRIPFPRLIGLTPLQNDNLQPAAEMIHVVGKNLAPLGLDFFHHDPIPQRYALVNLEQDRELSLRFLLKITWCRFLKPGWYDSGGRFTKVVEWPLPDAGRMSEIITK